MKKELTGMIIVAIGLVLLVAWFVARGFNKGDYNEMSQNICVEDCVDKLENAEEVLIFKDPIDFKKEYSVFVGEELVAKLKGKHFKLFGDVYSLYNENDELILKEEGRKHFRAKNGKVKFDRGGIIKNGDEKEVAYLVQPYTLGKTTFELRDLENNVNATLKGKFKLFRLRSEFSITDADKKEMYHLNKLRSFAETKYNMEVKDSSTVSVQEAIMMAVAADEENDD